MGEIVFDIETKNTFAEAGSSNPADLSISVVCIYDYSADAFLSFREEQVTKLWPMVENCDRIIGWNSIHFDMPLLEKYAGRSFSHVPHLDLCNKVKESLGTRMKLDDIAHATLGERKSGHGLQAVEWYKEGQWDKIISYCIQDVRITRDIYEFAKRNKQLFYSDFTGVKPFPVDVSHPAQKIAGASCAPVSVQMNLL